MLMGMGEGNGEWNMAQRRMFNKAITESDRFMCLPHSTQSLYLHLCMNADDDGFVGNPNTIVRMVQADERDLDWLTSNGYIIGFSSGIIVIRHWKVNNYLRVDRYTATIYKDELSLLAIDSEGVYMLPDEMIPAAEVLKEDGSAVPSPAPSRQKPQTPKVPKAPKTEKIKNDACMVEVFETLWKNYPKKESKEKALKTFEHKVRGLGEEEIKNTGNEIWLKLVTSLNNWKSTEIDIKFIPQFGTWLDNEIPDSSKYTQSRK